jgi:beta-glucosidase
VVFEALGDRVPLWSTINEPQVVVDAGYIHGSHPPGQRSLVEASLAAHYLLMAHGAAVRVYRETGCGKIGLVVNLEPKDPATGSPADRAAARRADAYMNRQYLDPVLLGRDPEDLAEVYGDARPRFPAEDFRLIGEPIDFLGINYYTRSVNRHDDSVPFLQAAPVRVPGAGYTETGWEVHPESLTRVLRWVRERYGDLPLYVTENGAAFPDPPQAEGGHLEDPLRVDFLRRHLRAAHEALAAGVDLRGYYVWSLLDNFEWAQGYSKRFGIVHVDFDTQTRTPKASALVYRDIIRSRGEAVLAPPPV